MKPKRFLSVTMLLASLLIAAFASVRALDGGGTATPAPSSNYALEFPVAMPTDVQIAEARACDLANLPAQRYPTALKVDELAAAYTPDSACDWAVLALAHQQRAGDNQPPSEAGKQAYLRAVSDNPAYGLALPMLIAYFGQVDLVAPPLPDQAITDVEIRYSWAGLGSPVNYAVQVAHADTAPVVSGNVDVQPEFFDLATPQTSTPIPPTPFALQKTVDSQLVQGLHGGLQDLLPIGKSFSDTPCWDDYPDWTVTLTFSDGTRIEMVTNQSNVLSAGGPWQTKINGQRYLQVSAAFLKALFNLTDALKLPYGEPAAMGCGGNYADPLMEAFEP